MVTRENLIDKYALISVFNKNLKKLNLKLDIFRLKVEFFKQCFSFINKPF